MGIATMESNGTQLIDEGVRHLAVYHSPMHSRGSCVETRKAFPVIRGRAGLFTLVLVMGMAPGAVGLPRVINAPFFIAAILLAGRVAFGGRLPVAVKRAVLVLVSMSVCVTVCDLVLRWPAPQLLHYRPDDRFLYRWPLDVDLLRFSPNVAFDGEVYGDLAAISGDKSMRESRHIRFETGPLGFRNDSPFPVEPVDLILLGDSFGVGSSTSQEHTWGSIFRSKYGTRVYNLSMSGSPWGGLMNLKGCVDDVPCRPGTIVLWALFEGNDLDEDYRDDFIPLTNPGLLGQIQSSYQQFRVRSPIREMLYRLNYSSDVSLNVEDVRIAGGMVLHYLDIYRERSLRTHEQVLRHRNYPLLEATFEEMRCFCARMKLRPVVVVIPSKFRVYHEFSTDSKRACETLPSGFVKALRSMCEQNEMPLLDLAPHLVKEARRALAEGEMLWWPDDSHWNNRGHQAAAEVVHRKLLKPMLAGR